MSALQPLPITPPPGVVKTESSRVIEGRWSDSDGVRFYRLRPQKNGGYVKAVATPTSGVPRAIHAWRDLSFNGYIAAGTYRKLYVYDTILAQNDITPFRSTGTLANNPFTTTISTPNISVTHTGHGLGAGDTIIFTGATAVGGVTPNGTFTVATVTDTNHYVFVFTSNATSSTTGGGAAVLFSYEIPVGTELGTFGLGYGVGGYGLGTYGDPHSGSTIFIEPRVWSLDHFGKLLLAAYNGGSLYTFDPTAAQPWGRAQIVAAAPTNFRAMFITPERFVFALCDAMTVQWCTQGDFTVWTPATNNTANSRVLTEGTKLVGGKVLGPFVSLVWTDAALYSFQYTGTQFVYNSSMVGRDCGLVGPNAAVTANGIAYWMGSDNFFMFNGSVTPMPNADDIRRFVYDTLDSSLTYQCSATYNPRFNEVWFSYTVTGAMNPSLIVVYSIDQQCWWPLMLPRCAGSHFTQGDTRPYMGAPDGFIYQQENTNDAAGAVAPWTLTLAPYAMSEGYTNVMTESILWDFFNQSGAITITVNTFDRLTDSAPMDTETDVIPDVDAGLTDIRVSGRYLSPTLSNSTLGSYFRLGKPVAFIKTIGRRS